MRRARLLAVAVLMGVVACGGGDGGRVLVAAGTTLVDSGLIDALADRYEAVRPGVEISVVGEASAQVLELGRRGGADVLITHAPALEERFLAEGLAELSGVAFSSDFVLVGPPGLVGSLGGPIEEVLAAVAARQLEFVSRGDGSGTHQRELALWSQAGVDPAGAPWYRETGQGMGLTLIVADQVGALTLAERGAYTAAAEQLSLRPLEVEASPALVNPYRVTLVVERGDAAGDFARWLLDEAAEELPAINQELFNEPIYTAAG